MILRTPAGQPLVVDVARTWLERTRGLLGRRGLEPDHGLLLPGARSVHTVRMRFPIAVAFLDDDLGVIEVQPVAPGRVLLPRRRARHVLELAETTALRAGGQLVRDDASPLREEGADQRQHGDRGDGQDRDQGAREPSDGGGKRDGPAARALGGKEPQELEQRAHGVIIGSTGTHHGCLRSEPR